MDKPRQINFHSQVAPEAVGPYPHARRVGDLLFVSGIGPRRRGTSDIPGVTLGSDGRISSHDVALQTRSCLENVRAILQEAGLDLEDIVDLQVFLTDIKADFKAFNAVYAEYFDAESGPTRTTVGVTGLPTPIAVELKVIAHLGQGTRAR